MKPYAIVIEQAGSNCSAFVPDLPGCAATGATRAETVQRIRRAITLHIEGLRADGLDAPEPTTTVTTAAPRSTAATQ